MLKRLTAAVLKDSFSLLRNDRDFFAKNSQQRLDLIKSEYGEKYSSNISSYLTEISEEKFMQDVKATLKFLNENLVSEGNELLDAIALYVSNDLAQVLDEFDSEFFWKDIDERALDLAEFFNGQSALSKLSKDIFMTSTYQDISSLAFNILYKIKDISVTVLQTPIELNSKGRKKIRSSFLERNPYVFVEFQVNPSLIGGMRVFENGKVSDQSWLNKVQRLETLNS